MIISLDSDPGSQMSNKAGMRMMITLKRDGRLSPIFPTQFVRVVSVRVLSSKENVVGSSESAAVKRHVGNLLFEVQSRTHIVKNRWSPLDTMAVGIESYACHCSWESCGS